MYMYMYMYMYIYIYIYIHIYHVEPNTRRRAKAPTSRYPWQDPSYVFVCWSDRASTKVALVKLVS